MNRDSIQGFMFGMATGFLIAFFLKPVEQATDAVDNGRPAAVPAARGKNALGHKHGNVSPGGLAAMVGR
jgi:hypothetical protein